MKYWQIYRNWLTGVLKQRILLSRQGYAPYLLESATALQKLIDYHGYRSNPLLAGFLVRKAEEIKLLIPNNKAYERNTQTLTQALEEAQKYCPSTR